MTMAELFRHTDEAGDTVHVAGPEECPPPRDPDSDDGHSVFEGISSATVLKPGDRLLIEMGDGCTREMLDKMAAAMKGRFPDVDFTFLAGVNSVFVVPAATPVQPVSQTITEEEQRDCV